MRVPAVLVALVPGAARAGRPGAVAPGARRTGQLRRRPGGRAVGDGVQRGAALGPLPRGERRALQLPVPRPREGGRRHGGGGGGRDQDAAGRRLPAQSPGDDGSGAVPQPERLRDGRGAHPRASTCCPAPCRSSKPWRRPVRRRPGRRRGADPAPERAARATCRATMPERSDADVQRVNLREIETGRLSKNVTIRDGDTIFVPKAERFFVTGLRPHAGLVYPRAQHDRAAGHLDGWRRDRARLGPPAAGEPRGGRASARTSTPSRPTWCSRATRSPCDSACCEAGVPQPLRADGRRRSGALRAAVGAPRRAPRVVAGAGGGGRRSARRPGAARSACR